MVIGVLAAPATALATTLIGSGSSAAQPYMLELFRGYNKLHHKIHFKYIPDGGNAGVKDVQQHRSQFAIQTRPPLPSDAGTTYDKLFLDGLCLAVNPANHLGNVTLGQAKDMFTAVDTNWNQVPGSGLSTTIDPVGRNSSAGSYTFFQSAVLNGATQASNVQQQTSDGLVAVAVSKDKSAIGYVGLAHSGKGSGVKKLTVNGIPCDARSHQERELSAVPLHLVGAADGRAEPAGRELPRLGPDQQGRGQDHRQVRRSSRVQQALNEKGRDSRPDGRR